MDDFKRRDFIKLSALGFAGIALQLGSISSYAQQANAHLGKWDSGTKLNWDAFLERLSKLAKTQHQLPWDQKSYTKKVKKLLLQCNFPEFENVKKEILAYEDKTPNIFEAASLHREVDFQVSLFQFEKGEYISHHDHPDMTGVINVVSGSALTKNYTIEEQLSATREVITHGRASIMQKCTIREIENDILTGGDVSILTAHKGNIHSIMPNEFTQLVDVFTPSYKQDTKTNWYTVNEEGFYQGRKNLFEAEYVDPTRSTIKTIALGSTILDRYTGVYKMGDSRFLRISREEENLFMQRTKNLDDHEEGTKLLPYEENGFWIEGQEIRVVFNIGNENQTKGLTVFFKDRGIPAEKIK